MKSMETLLIQQFYKFKFLIKKFASIPVMYNVIAKYTTPNDIEEKKYKIDGIGLY